jgi:hypothetical protein
MNGLAAGWTGRALSEVVGAEIYEAIRQIYIFAAAASVDNNSQVYSS